MSIKGKIMISKGNENKCPQVVYVSHWSENFECWKTPVLNSGELGFNKPEDLLPFDYKTFQQLFFKWEIEEAERLKKIAEQNLSEWLP